jgi:two-component system OmpR family sensor kinase
MFKSLQARLTLSYAIIILICLVLVGLATLVLLNGYQRNLTYRRLTDRAILAARLPADSLRRGGSPQAMVERLAQQMNQGDDPRVFVVLLDPMGQVVAGNNDRLVGQQFENLVFRSVPSSAWPVRGERRLAVGERLLYVAEPVRTPGELGLGEPAYILLLGQLYRPLPLTLGDLLPRLAWAGALALALSLVVAAMMAYWIAHPLDRIARAAEEVAGGNYEQQLDISAPAEVARLAASFNSMARQVRTMLQSQQDLVANVSHDLKTPLTSIQGFSQALLDGTAADPVARERAAVVIYEEAGRMRRLVDELLDLARLEAGEVALACELVDVGELLRSCAARFALQSEQAGVEVEVEVAPLLPAVTGDVDRLGQVFGNLMDNAFKYAHSAPGGGRVVLRAEQRDRLVVCSVSDNGPGIPAEDLPRIFERFYQVDKSRVRRAGSTPLSTIAGAGLGLAIAREIVQAHGGRIWAESVEGLGSRFTVELPTRSG